MKIVRGKFITERKRELKNGIFETPFADTFLRLITEN